jgi:hypothetical protein
MILLIGDFRKDALMRVFALLYAWFIAALIAGLVAIAGLIWMVIDVLWQFLVNSEGLSENGRAADIVASALEWNMELNVYALTGKKEFMWLPDL